MSTALPLEPAFVLQDCERHIARVWADVLQYRGTISANANFFEIGGDSLTLMMMLFQVGELYQLEIQPWSFIEQPTLGSLCRRVCSESPGSTSTGGSSPATKVLQEGEI